MPGRGGPASPKGGNRGNRIPGIGPQSDSDSSKKGNDGLKPNRPKEFIGQGRIETPTLNDMKAKEGAIVSKFMTFSNRKNTVMIELYERPSTTGGQAGTV